MENVHTPSEAHPLKRKRSEICFFVIGYRSKALFTMKKGTVDITSGTSVWCRNNGRLTCTDPVTDFTPPQTDSIVLRLDAADAQETTQRGGGESMMPRVGAGGIQWTPRITRNPSPNVVFQSSRVAFGSKNGRRTIAFRPESGGMEGTWGPFASPAFTVVAVLRILEPVTTTIPLLRSGAMTLNLPMDNTAPQPMLENRTWGDAFLFQWRQLVIQNSLMENGQYWMVDGNLVTTQPLFAQQFSTIATVTIGGTGPLEIAEVIVWDEVLPTSTLMTIATNLTTKWNTAINYPPQAPLPVALPIVDGGYTLPVPNVLWLDSSKPSSMLTDTGSSTNHLQPRVAVWQDQSGNNRHATFDSPHALLNFSPAASINGRPLVRIKTSPGVLPSDVLSAIGAGPFVIVAVWEPNFVGGGGHPFNVNGRGWFAGDTWTEGVASDSDRPFPQPINDLEIMDLAPLVSVWERTTSSTITVRLNNVRTDPVAGGWVWSAPNVLDSNWVAQALTIGGASRSLGVGELMVWAGPAAESVQTMDGRSALSVHLLQKWGLMQAGSASPAVQVVAVLPTSGAEPALQTYTASDASTMLTADGSVGTVGQTILTWKGKRSDFLGDATNLYAGVGPTLSSVNARPCLLFPGTSTRALLSTLKMNTTGKIITIVARRSSENVGRNKFLLTAGFDSLSWAVGDWYVHSDANQQLEVRFVMNPSNGDSWPSPKWTLPLTPFGLQFYYYATGTNLRIRMFRGTASEWIESDHFVATWTGPLPIIDRHLTIGGKRNPNNWQYEWPGEIFEVHILNNEQTNTATQLREDLRVKYL